VDAAKPTASYAADGRKSIGRRIWKRFSETVM
jgi:hypothetical protein